MLIDSSKTKELYDACNRFLNELNDYSSLISEFSSLIIDCESIVPVEQDECFERCIWILSEHLDRNKYFIQSVNGYVDQCINSIDNEKMLDIIITQTKGLISDLSERFPSDSDIEDLKCTLIDCQRISDYWCSQRWQGGKSCIGIENIDVVMDKYIKLFESVQELMIILENCMYQLAEAQRNIIRAYVDGLPEIMEDIVAKPVNEQTYPYIHSISDDEDVLMKEVYASPRMISDYQRSITGKNREHDGDNRIAFCMQCGKPITNGNSFCLVCGNRMRENVVSERPISSMADVYASPEMMSDYDIVAKPVNEQTYPYIHSISDDEDVLMKEVYASPRMMSDYQRSITGKNREHDGDNRIAFCMQCGKPITNGNSFCLVCGKNNAITDPDITSQFCRKCGMSNPLIAKYCMFCGNRMRENTVSERPISSMACVYASPEMMSKQKKKGFFKKLFKRN